MKSSSFFCPFPRLKVGFLGDGHSAGYVLGRRRVGVGRGTRMGGAIAIAEHALIAEVISSVRRAVIRDRRSRGVDGGGRRILREGREEGGKGRAKGGTVRSIDAGEIINNRTEIFGRESLINPTKIVRESDIRVGGCVETHVVVLKRRRRDRRGARVGGIRRIRVGVYVGDSIISI